MNKTHLLPQNSKIFRYQYFLLLVLTLTLSVFIVSPVKAATITVNSNDDEVNSDGDCSFREAVAASEANANVDGCSGTGAYGDDTINLDNLTDYILVTGGEMVITQNLVVHGPGSTIFTMYGDSFAPVLADRNRLFHFQPSTTNKSLTLSGFTAYSFGDASCILDKGGTVKTTQGTLNVTDINFSGACAENGGAIYSAGTLNVEDSIFLGNSTVLGGTITVASGIANITNSDFSGNASDAIRVNTGIVTVSDSTFASGFGTVMVNEAGTVTLDNILAEDMVFSFDESGSGAILNQASGTMTVTNSNILNNNFLENIRGGGLTNEGNCTITATNFTNNSISVAASGSGGGAIYNSGTLVIEDSAFADNYSESWGGAIVNYGGTLDIDTTTFNNNRANFGNAVISYPFNFNGGAIAVRGGIVNLNDSSITNNINSGIYVDAGATNITESTISGNTIYGGIRIEGGTVVVQQSTITNNNYANVASGGGGIQLNRVSANLTVINSTIAHNTATNGGGIYANNGTAVFINTTFSKNTATSDSNGGNIYFNGGSFSATNSLMVKGTTGKNCHGSAITNNGHNLQYGDSTCGAGITTAIANPLGLNVLANNGGSTLTIALSLGSEAIDSGDNTVCATVNTVNNLDQRGSVRPTDGDANGTATCDVGAYEFLLPPDTTPPTITDVTSSKANGTYTVGEIIPIQIEFSEVVNVTGTPRLTLETGNSDAIVNYASGTGTDTLIFNYTVGVGQSTLDLDYVASNSLVLNGGTIQDAASNAATLTLLTPGGTSSLGANKNIVIDAVAPVIMVITEITPNTTTDTTPTYVFSTDKEGTISYGGSCDSITADAVLGDNAITFEELSVGTYSDCTVQVTDEVGNLSNILAIESFEIITPPPTPTPGPSPSPQTRTSGGGSSSITSLSDLLRENDINEEGDHRVSGGDVQENSPQSPETRIVPKTPPPSLPKDVFLDIEGHPLADAILQLSRECDIQGYADELGNLLKSFKPDNKITRSEFVTMLMKCKFGTLLKSRALLFPDVSVDHPAAPYIKKGSELGIVEGYPDGTFKPNRYTNYAEGVKMIALTWLDLKEINQAPVSLQCQAVEQSQWYARYFNAGFYRGVTFKILDKKGNTLKECSPIRDITRAEAAKIIVDMKNKDPEASSVHGF